jgi:hypothetical protein
MAQAGDVVERFFAGEEGYLIMLSGGHGFASATDLKIAAHKEANAFCAGSNKRPETLLEKNAQAGILSDFSEEELKFRCIANPQVDVCWLNCGNFYQQKLLRQSDFV